MSGAARGGLGRGLAAILPSAEKSEKEHLSGHERVLHSLVDAGLDQLGAAAPLDLLAYLHLPRADEPVLFLRTPQLSTLSPTRAYRLFARFVQATRSGAAEGTFTQDSMVTVFLRTAGHASDGIHFLGHSHAVLDPGVLAGLRTTARTFATIGNQHVAGVPADLGTPRLVVELSDDTTKVHVAGASGAGRGPVAAADPQEAVARAVLEASGSNLAFVDAREVVLGDERAVLVVLRAPDGTAHPGFVVGDDDLLQSTAVATVRAITGR